MSNMQINGQGNVEEMGGYEEVHNESRFPLKNYQRCFSAISLDITSPFPLKV